MTTVSYFHTVASAMSATPSLARRIVTEGLGTALLITVMISMGTHASRLSDGDAIWMLLAQSLAGGASPLALLAVSVLVLRAHLNPAATFSALLQGDPRGHKALAYLIA